MKSKTLPIKNIVEAVLLAADGPMTVNQIIALFDEQERPQVKLVRDALDQLQNEYTKRGVELKEVASGFRFQTQQDYMPWLKNLYAQRPPPPLFTCFNGNLGFNCLSSADHPCRDRSGPRRCSKFTNH